MRQGLHWSSVAACGTRLYGDEQGVHVPMHVPNPTTHTMAGVCMYIGMRLRAGTLMHAGSAWQCQSKLQAALRANDSLLMTLHACMHLLSSTA